MGRVYAWATRLDAEPAEMVGYAQAVTAWLEANPASGQVRRADAFAHGLNGVPHQPHVYRITNLTKV